MQANESQGEQRATSSLPLMTRLARLAVYFGHQRLAWGLAIAATLVGAVTEPMIPALLAAVAGQGIHPRHPGAVDGSSGHHGGFLIRGLAQFIGQYALAKIANEGMLPVAQGSV